MARQLRIGVCFAFGLFIGLAVAWPYGDAVSRPFVAWEVSTIYHIEGCRYGPRVEYLTAAQVKTMTPCKFCVQRESKNPIATASTAKSNPSRK